MNEVKFKIAVLMMQKNERELLDKWIVYHSNLFGLVNLHVFDNGSDDEVTKNILLEWQLKGLSVDWSHSTKADFENKGVILGDNIKSLDTSGVYDCFVPLDCDEFLAVKLDNGDISCETEDIFAEFLRNSDCQDLLIIDAQFFNSPISSNWFHRFANRKCFFMKDTFQSMDVGFHWGKVKNSSAEKKTNLVQFHFHNKPFEDAREHARNKLALRVTNFDKEYLANYKGNGRHLTKYFLMSEKEYLQSVLKPQHYYVDSLANKFKESNIEWPYHDKMKKSLMILDPTANLDPEAKVKVLHRVVEESFKGSVDQILLQGDLIRLDGWCAKMSKLPINTFVLIGENGKQSLEVFSSVYRADISGLFGIKEQNFGFVINVSLEILRAIGVSDLRLHPKLKSGEVGPALPVNKKYKSLISDILN